MTALTLIVSGIASYCLFGFYAVIRLIADEGSRQDERVLALCVLTFILGLIIGAVAYFVGHGAREWTFAAKKRSRSATIPYEPMEKDPGYNKAVLFWFFNGPELRKPSVDFEDAFNARSEARRSQKVMRSVAERMRDRDETDRHFNSKP
tara:strand:- start:51794 stop:52240 length:447 start_codon:yes stop_codon:yes gene_type:complete